MKKLVFNSYTFADHVKKGMVTLYTTDNGNINLSAYIMAHQTDTKLYDFVNRDVSIIYDPQTTKETWQGIQWPGQEKDEYNPTYALEINTYGKHTPNYIRKALNDMVTIIERLGGLK